MSARHELIRAASGPGTFLGNLPPESLEALLVDAEVIEARRGATVFAATEPANRFGVVLDGICRTYLTANDGRRLTVRYARVGAVVASLTSERAALSVQAMSDCSLLEVELTTLQRAITVDGRVGLVLIGEVGQRLADTYATLASNTFGSMRERVARHVLDLSVQGAEGQGLRALVTQQGLADSVGTVREVVARVLRDMRLEGLVETKPGHIVILDPDRLAAIIGRDTT